LENDVGVGVCLVIAIATLLACMSLFHVYQFVLVGCAPSAYVSGGAFHTSSYHHGVVQEVFQPLAVHADRDFYSTPTELELMH
jgi:hypothetical protein